MEVFVSKYKYFMHSAKFDRQPVNIMKHRSDMVGEANKSGFLQQNFDCVEAQKYEDMEGCIKDYFAHIEKGKL